MSRIILPRAWVSEEQLQLFVEHVPAAVAMFDRDMRYLAVSRRWVTDFGLREVKLHGRSHYDVFPDIPERWRLVHQRALAGEVQSSADDRWDRGDGTAQWLRWECQPWPASNGSVGGILIFAEDVTAHKQAEEALRSSEQRKDEFLATLAHELRNPLAPIRNGFELLRRSLVGEGRRLEVEAMIERQLGHLIRLVDDLLDVARIGRGVVALERERLQLRTVLEHAVESSRSRVEGGRHALVVRTPATAVWVEGDLTRLAQVVGNLLDNAAKYTPSGGRIELWMGVEGAEAVIRVTDDGIGIAPEMLPRVFDLFAQVDRAPDRTQGGLGIGLSLVRQLVELHEGTIVAESAGLGRGSTFTVRLPLAAVEADQPKSTSVGQVRAGSGSTAGRRILVVDDNTDGAETFAMLLDLAGHQTRFAGSGVMALEIAQAFGPEVVFLDIGLPGMDGYEVARRLRAEPTTAETMLVAVTGWGSEQDERRCLEAGFDVHLVKPVAPAVVAEVLARGRGGADARR